MCLNVVPRTDLINPEWMVLEARIDPNMKKRTAIEEMTTVRRTRPA